MDYTRCRNSLVVGLFCFLTAIAWSWPSWGAGMVTFSFDDGLSSVYEEAFPILKKHRQRATVGIVFSRVTSGRTSDYMTKKQVMELQKNGWEIASHGLTHQRPTDIPKYFSDELLEGWKLEEGIQCQCVYEAKYDYEFIGGLTENDQHLRELSSIEDIARVPGSYYFDRLVGAIHVHPFDPVPPKDLRIKSISYQREMRDSKKGLEALGFDVSTYVAPYNYWTPEMRELSKYYYDQVANGGEAANYKGTFDRHWIKRFFIHTLGPADEVIRLVQKKAVSENGWIILCFHGIEDETGWQPWSEENLEQLSAWLEEQGVRVVTIGEGAAILNEGE